MELLTTDAAKAAYTKLQEMGQNGPFWKYMLALNCVPRGSGNRGPVTEFVKAVCAEKGWNVDVDNESNCKITVPATPGYENVTSICLQGHSDMVCVAEDGYDIDFKTDAIVPEITTREGREEHWLTAKGTSLGADNGIAIAMCFALLEDTELKHGPLEILITSDEEIGLVGVSNMSEGWLKSKYLINVDSEDEYVITVGCAGGYTSTATLDLERTESKGDHVTFAVERLSGGHTGVDINTGRTSAIKVVGRILAAVRREGVSYQIVAANGGAAHNAIPRSVRTTVVTPDAARFREVVEREFGYIKTEHRFFDPNMALSFDEKHTDLKPITEEQTRKVVNMMNILPFGPIRLDAALDNKVVETSYATTIIKTDEKELYFLGSGRSSCEEHLTHVHDLFGCMCDLSGFTSSHTIDRYPGWQPDMESPLLETMIDIHKEVTGRDPVVETIHAGLECGIVVSKHPGMGVQAISIGPQLENPHSVNEFVGVESSERTYKLLLATVGAIAEKEK